MQDPNRPRLPPRAPDRDTRRHYIALGLGGVGLVVAGILVDVFTGAEPTRIVLYATATPAAATPAPPSAVQPTAPPIATIPPPPERATVT